MTTEDDGGRRRATEGDGGRRRTDNGGRRRTTDDGGRRKTTEDEGGRRRTRGGDGGPRRTMEDHRRPRRTTDDDGRRRTTVSDVAQDVAQVDTSLAKQLPIPCLSHARQPDESTLRPMAPRPPQLEAMPCVLGDWSGGIGRALPPAKHCPAASSATQRRCPATRRSSTTAASA